MTDCEIEEYKNWRHRRPKRYHHRRWHPWESRGYWYRPYFPMCNCITSSLSPDVSQAIRGGIIAGDCTPGTLENCWCYDTCSPGQGWWNCRDSRMGGLGTGNGTCRFIRN